ncbi:MAG: PIG-L family deacetylase [Pseudomonadota bacterium]
MQFCEQHFIPYAALSSLGPGPAIVFAPHPDDEVFGCGGAIMRHVSSADPVRVVIVTDGAYGPPTDPDAYARTRQQESTKAAAILGYGTPEFWNLPDRGLEYGEHLVRRILATIEGCAAELVYAPSWWEIHPDHRVLALAVAEAVRRCSRPIRLAMYEVGVPLQPNVLLDITDLAERKAAAMASFSSQLAQQNYDKQIAALNCFRTYTLPQTIQAAEGYLVLSAEELRGANSSMMALRDHLAVRGENDATATMPLVSVIIRSMGSGHLKDTLGSVALQTYPHIEVVVVNVKGEGHTPLEHWCGRFPLRFVSADTPLSRSRAANTGLAHAEGEYLVFLDDGDIFFPDYAASLVEALKGQSFSRCAYTGVQVERYSAGRLTGRRRFNEPFQPEKLLESNLMPSPSVLFHRSLLDLQCRFNENLAMAEEWDFWLQAAQHTTFIHVDKISACHRIHEDLSFGPKVDTHLSMTTAGTGAGFDKGKNTSNRDNHTGQSTQLLDALQSHLDGQGSMPNLASRYLSETRNHLVEQEAEPRRARDRLSDCGAELENCQASVAPENAEIEARNDELGRARQSINMLVTVRLGTQKSLALIAAWANRLRLRHDTDFGSSSKRATVPLRLGSRPARGRYREAEESLRRHVRLGGRAVYKILPRHLANRFVRTMYCHFGPIFAGFSDWGRRGRDPSFSPKGARDI